MSNDGRRPSNLENLLKICIENTSADEPTTTDRQFSQQDREFLQAAMNQMRENDPVKHMMTLLAAVFEEEDDEQRTNILETLQDYCEDVDLALNFHKVGGFRLFDRFLEAANDNNCAASASVLAALCQNHPYCQKAALEHGLLPRLLALVDSDRSAAVRVKAMYAVSCLCRDCESAIEEFAAKDGFCTLLRAMQTDVVKLKTKAAFFLNSVCVSFSKYKDTVHNMGMEEQLVGMVCAAPHTDESEQFNEQVMAALTTLLKDNPDARELCARAELRETLRVKLQSLPTDSDERRLCAQLEKICFSTKQPECHVER